ncbi:MAG: hypothetical protein GAK45_00404 [Pseudomonas citronellolis]|nr:MAG: hypothetical protein GAK45_00404 [Pseudomonas citronellolis]
MIPSLVNEVRVALALPKMPVALSTSPENELIALRSTPPCRLLL